MLIWLLLGGLIAGSAASAIGDRLVDGRNWLTARSTCDNCQSRLSWLELIPLLSWLIQKGRCRQCRQPISWHYPALELGGAAAWGAIYWWWPLSTSGFDLVWLIGWLIAASCFLILFVADYRWLILPTSVIMALFWLGLGLRLIESIWVDQSPAGLILAVGGMIIGGGLFYLLYSISPRLIGFGDIRLGATLGIWLGTGLLTAWAIAVGSWVGLILAIVWLVFKKRPAIRADDQKDARIPFGPSLMIGCLVVWLSSNWLATQGLI